MGWDGTSKPRGDWPGLLRQECRHSLPEAVFAVGHDVEAHEEIRGGVHDDASAEVFAPDAEEVGEAAVDEGGGAIRGAVGENEEAGNDEVGEPVGLSKGLFPVVSFPIEDETHEEAAPEDFLDEGDDDGGADETEC